MIPRSAICLWQSRLQLVPAGAGLFETRLAGGTGEELEWWS